MGGKTQDFGDIAAAQGADNRKVVNDQLYANRPSQYTPWGYTNWTTEQVPDGQGGSTTKWSQTQGLTPELQELLNKQVAIQGARTDIAGSLTNRIGNEFTAPIDWRGLSPMGAVPTSQYTLPEEYGGPEIGDSRDLRGRAEEALMDKSMSRLAPQFEAQKNALEIKLRNQGIGPEDEAWKSQFQALGLQENDAYAQAQYDAVRGGLGEQQQLFGEDVTRRQQGVGEAQQRFGQSLSANTSNFDQAMRSSSYANTIRQQQITEAMQKRGYSLNEINALLNGQQVSPQQMPSFSQGGAAQAAPTYDAAQQQFNQQTMNDQATLDAAAQVAAAYFGMG